VRGRLQAVEREARANRVAGRQRAEQRDAGARLMSPRYGPRTILFWIARRLEE